MSHAVATLLVTASIVLTVAEVMHSSSSSFFFRLGDNLLLAAALVSVGAAIGTRRMSKDTAKVSLPVRRRVAAAAAAVPVIATLVHHRGLELYPLLVAVLVGASAAAIAAREPRASAEIPAPIHMSFWLAFAIIAVAGRYLAAGTILQSYVVAPLFVLAMPGLALSYSLLPATTGLWERLFWAPALSLGTQIVSLLWLDWLGVTAWVPVFVTVVVYFTVLGLSAAPSFPSESAP